MSQSYEFPAYRYHQDGRMTKAKSQRDVDGLGAAWTDAPCPGVDYDKETSIRDALDSVVVEAPQTTPAPLLPTEAEYLAAGYTGDYAAFMAHAIEDLEAHGETLPPEFEQFRRQPVPVPETPAPVEVVPEPAAEVVPEAVPAAVEAAPEGDVAPPTEVAEPESAGSAEPVASPVPVEAPAPTNGKKGKNGKKSAEVH